jgi:hypothetical protein
MLAATGLIVVSITHMLSYPQLVAQAMKEMMSF